MTGDSSNEDGYLTLLPYLRSGRVIFDSLITVLAPWGAPLVSAMSGKSEAGDPWLTLINESPIAYLRPSAPLDQKGLEAMHLGRLAVDSRMATGREAFDAVLRTGEPPDFVVSSSGREVG